MSIAIIAAKLQHQFVIKLKFIGFKRKWQDSIMAPLPGNLNNFTLLVLMVINLTGVV